MLLVLSIELVSNHPYGPYNCEVDPSFLESLLTPDLTWNLRSKFAALYL